MIRPGRRGFSYKNAFSGSKMGHAQQFERYLKGRLKRTKGYIRALFRTRAEERTLFGGV